MRRAMQQGQPFSVYLPDGGTLPGGISSQAAHITMHKSNIRYIPPDAVEAYYILRLKDLRGSALEDGIELAISGLDIAFGSKITGSLLLLLNVMEKTTAVMSEYALDTFFEQVINAGQGIVVYDLIPEGDPRIMPIYNIMKPWTTYPYGLNPRVE